MKISEKELQSIIAEEIELAKKEGEIEEGFLDKLKKGYDFLTKGKAVDASADETEDEKEIEDKQADFQQDLDKEEADVKTAMGNLSDEMMDVLNKAKDATYQLGTLAQNFVHDPADEQSNKVAADLEKFIVSTTELNMAYKKHLKDFSELRFALDPESDKSKFKHDPTASAKTRAGMGLGGQSKARGPAHMFEGNNKNAKYLRKVVQEEIYKELMKKVKK